MTRTEEGCALQTFCFSFGYLCGMLKILWAVLVQSTCLATFPYLVLLTCTCADVPCRGFVKYHGRCHGCYSACVAVGASMCTSVSRSI